MASKAKKKAAASNHKLRWLFIFAATLLLLFFLWLAGLKILMYKQVADTAAIEPVRELIIRGVESIKQPAPVDFKTGDIYFPEAKLYLPAPDTTTSLEYGWQGDTPQDQQLSIANSQVTDQMASRLISSQDINTLFEAVPKLQACHRGVYISYKFSSEENLLLKHEVVLESGKKLYIAIERECSELNGTAQLLTGLKEF